MRREVEITIAVKRLKRELMMRARKVRITWGG